MTLSKLVSKLGGLLPGLDDADAAEGSEAAFLTRWEENWRNAASVAGTTAIAERTVFRARRKCRLIKAWIVGDAAVTADGTNYFTVLVDKRAATDYTTPVNLITFAADTPTTDNLVAFTPKAIGPGSDHASATATVFDLNRGDVVTIEVTKTGGSGLAFPISSVLFQIEPRD